MRYTILGKFNTGDEWKETAHNKSELEFVLDKINKNETIANYNIFNSKGMCITDEVLS